MQERSKIDISPPRPIWPAGYSQNMRAQCNTFPLRNGEGQRGRSGACVEDLQAQAPAPQGERREQKAIIMQPNNDLDATCINTIRTLSMDAVQAANSGHPGAPMALAPVAYCLWQQFLRFDPQDPIWPNRDRFVLSAGHASMLLYSLLHLTGVKAVSKDYETLGEPSVPLEAIKRFRQLGSRCPGHPGVSLDQRRRDHDRPARAGAGQQRRHGDRRAVAGRPVQPAGLRGPDRLQRLRPVRRRLHHGRHFGRGRVAGRPPEALQPLLDLRQQPHHDRGEHGAGLQRRRGHALHRPRLERDARRRRQRPGDAGAGLPHLPEHARPADADHRG